MIIIFDLDDTLYEEITFVKSGFKAVSSFLKRPLQEKEDNIYKELIYILEKHGRNKIFDNLLLKKNKYKKKLINECIKVYRYHKPVINLYPEAKNFLNSYKEKGLYLVTDGHKNVQYRKIRSLNLEKFFKKIFITHRFGIKHAKPSLYCFEKIKVNEKCKWEDLVYIGDNPNKDFISLNKVNAKTIRVKQGNYSKICLPQNYDAKYSINNLGSLNSLLKNLKND